MRSKMRLKGREIISLLNELEPYFQPYRLPNCFKHFWKLPSKHHWRTSQLYREKFNILLPNINLNSLKSSLRSFFSFRSKIYDRLIVDSTRHESIVQSHDAFLSLLLCVSSQRNSYQFAPLNEKSFINWRDFWLWYISICKANFLFGTKRHKI